jgi:hypothetical protein
MNAFRPNRRRLAALTVAACLCAATLFAAPGRVHAQATTKPAPAAAPAAPAAPATQDPHRRDDIARHRAIAAAHDTAARCLETGGKESTCHDALRKACEGIAVGRYCGMKHSH